MFDCGEVSQPPSAMLANRADVSKTAKTVMKLLPFDTYSKFLTFFKHVKVKWAQISRNSCSHLNFTVRDFVFKVLSQLKILCWV